MILKRCSVWDDSCRRRVAGGSVFFRFCFIHRFEERCPFYVKVSCSGGEVDVVWSASWHGLVAGQQFHVIVGLWFAVPPYLHCECRVEIVPRDELIS